MSNYWKHKMRTKSPAVIAGWILLGAIAIVGIAILFGYIIMSLWNWLMPDLFGLTTITYWQAVGLFILAKIIFGGFGGSSDNSKCDSKPSDKKSKKKDFSKWKQYDTYWEEEGEVAYQTYIDKQNNPATESTSAES